MTHSDDTDAVAAYLGLDPVIVIDLGQILDTVVSKDGYNDTPRLCSLGDLNGSMQVETSRPSHQHSFLLGQAAAHLHSRNFCDSLLYQD